MSSTCSRVSPLLSAEDSDPVVLWSGEVDRYICVVSHGTAATGVDTDPLRPSFFSFILLFWNQILTCLSFRPSVAASSSRLGLQRHCLEVHVEEFLTLKGEGDKGLSWYSEQAYEAVHHHFNLEEERTRLQPDHPNFRENLLRTVLRFNGKNI